jgi:hypothetical protein
MDTIRQAIIKLLKERGELLLDHHGAEKLADEILNAIKPKVVVEVSGGSAHSVYATMPMDVIVRDHDNIKAGDEDPLNGADLAKSTDYVEVY